MMSVLRGCLVVALLLLSSVAVMPAAQDRAFKSAVELVTIHFLAMAGDGSPIADLKREELSLLVDGEPRAIQQLQFVGRSDRTQDAGAAAAAGRPVDGALPATAPIVEPGRRIVIAANPEATVRGTERLIIEAAAEFIRGLLPADELTIVTLPMGRVLSTPDRSRTFALNALKQIVSYGAPGYPIANCSHLSALEELLRSFEGGSESTTVIYVSGALPAAADCVLVFESLRQAAEAAGARFFVFEPNNFLMDASQRRPLSEPASPPSVGLGDLASATGGELFRISGRATTAFERVTREISGRFTLGFEPSPSDRDGAAHKVRLGISRRGVTIHAAPSVTIRSSLHKDSTLSAFEATPRRNPGLWAVTKDEPLKQLDAAALLFGGAQGTGSGLRVVRLQGG